MTSEGNVDKGSRAGRLLGGVASAAAGVGVSWLAGHEGDTLGPLPLAAAAACFAVAVQWLAFVPAVLLRTERFYDVTGSLTYLSLVGGLVLLGDPGPRGLVLAGCVALWALRLGLFLGWRIHKTGGDGRFDAIKLDPSRFFVAWSLQGLWVTLTALAVTLTLTSAPESITPLDAVGWALFTVGFLIEAVADAQKSAFKADPNTSGWCDRGLWAWSRHPNYFGEILLWTGLAVSASSGFSGWEWLGLLSPLFVYVLLRHGSGVPLAEERWDHRYGDDPAYQRWKAETPLLVPRPPRRG